MGTTLLLLTKFGPLVDHGESIAAYKFHLGVHIKSFFLGVHMCNIPICCKAEYWVKNILFSLDACWAKRENKLLKIF